MEKVTIKRYSEAFRRQVVREYESGASMNRLGKKYGITGKSTIPKWIKKYGRQGFRHEVVRIQSMEEANRVKELESRIRDMETAASQLLLENLMLKSTLEVVEQEYNIDIKKNAPKSLSEHRR